jgi:hypothetical protein
VCLFLSSNPAAAGKNPKTVCSQVLLVNRGPTPISLTRFWKGEQLTVDFTRIADVNAVLVWEIAEFFKSKKRLPFETELAPKLKKYLSGLPSESDNLLRSSIEDFRSYATLTGSADGFDHLLKIALEELPNHFGAIKDAAAKVLMTSFKSTLRPAHFSEIAEKLKMLPEDLEKVLGEPKVFWAEAKNRYPTLYLDARTKIIKAFIRAVQQKDLPDYKKTQASTPEFGEIYTALLRTDTNKAIQADFMAGHFNENTLRTLLNLPLSQTGPAEDLGFPIPVLFASGITQLEDEARMMSPGLFKNYLPDTIFSEERAERARDAIVNKDGFLITSVTAGIPLDEKLLAGLLTLSDRLDYPIMVLPTNQVLDGIDPRLLENPRIHVLTNTIENDFIKVWSLPIMPKNQNPFASLDQRGQFEPGQTVIVGHPQIAHRIVPTGSNHLRETALWSSGSLSQALYPYRLPIQGRTSGLAENYHRNGFLVVQKADRKAGLMSEGIRNFWHVRPVEFVDDSEQGKPAGFTDLGQRYTVTKNPDDTYRVEIGRQEPVALVVGDLHDWVADQRMLLSYRDILARFESLRDVYIHDPIDGFSHNHHEAAQYSLLMQKYRLGSLDYHREMMGLVQTTNAFLAMRPNIRVLFPDSNHSYWGRRLVDTQPDSQLVVNGTFLTELTHAKRILGIDDPLEYVFQYRERYIQSLPLPVRLDFQSRAVRVIDPLRVQVIPFGQSHVVGPEYRPVHLNHHGHQGTNGAKGSIRSHAIANENSVVGDSHQSAIWGGLLNVGTSTPKRVGYNDGGYSSWTNSFAVVYADGTKQLITYSSQSATFEQRAGVSPLAPSEFFGDSPLKVIPTANQLLPGVDVMDAHSQWVDLLKGKLK